MFSWAFSRELWHAVCSLVPERDSIMEERAVNSIRLLPRDDLETFAIRAATHMRDSRMELEASRHFLSVLTGFLLGVLVAAAGFLLGAGNSRLAVCVLLAIPVLVSIATLVRVPLTKIDGEE